MKTKEELNALKEEIAVLNKKIAELSPEELQEVTGGVYPQQRVRPDGTVIGPEPSWQNFKVGPTCLECGMTFASPLQLTRHMDTVHKSSSLPEQ